MITAPSTNKKRYSQIMKAENICYLLYKQYGPSLESNSFLNMSLRYLSPWYPGTLEPLDLDPWSLGLLQSLLPTHFPGYGLVMG